MSEITILWTGFCFSIVSGISLIVYLLINLIIWHIERREKTRCNQIKNTDFISLKDIDDLEKKIIKEALANEFLEENSLLHKKNDNGKSFLLKDVREIIIAKDKICAVKKSMNIQSVINYMAIHNISQCPVHGNSIDDIVGFISLKKLLKKYLQSEEKDKSQINWQDCVEMTPFISGSISICNAFSQMRQKNSHIAVVIDEYAKTIGIITEHDIILGILKTFEIYN